MSAEAMTLGYAERVMRGQKVLVSGAELRAARDLVMAEYDRRGKEIERLRGHILDIDAHATPDGDIPGEPGYTGVYLVTAGALHRALGTIGHTAPSCQAEAERRKLSADLEQLRESHRAVVAGMYAETERLRARTHEIQAQEMTKRAALDSEVARWRQRYEVARQWTEDNDLRAEWASGKYAAHPFWHMTSWNARTALLRLVTERDESVAQVARVRALHAELRVDDEGYLTCVHCGGDYPCDTLAVLDGSTDTPPPTPDPQPVNADLLGRLRSGVTSREPEIIASSNTTPQDKGVVYSLRLTGPELELLQAAANKRNLLIGRFIKQTALTAAAGSGAVSTTPDPAATNLSINCCDCICEHQCPKDPRVIGHQGCFACKWCSCDAVHSPRSVPVSPREDETPEPAPTTIDAIAWYCTECGELRAAANQPTTTICTNCGGSEIVGQGIGRSRRATVSAVEHEDNHRDASVPGCAWCAEAHGIEADDEVWIPPATDCMEYRADFPCPHCGGEPYHHRTGRCGKCGRRRPAPWLAGNSEATS